VKSGKDCTKPGILSLTELSLVALAKASLEVPAGLAAEAVDHVVFAMPRDVRLKLALGHFPNKWLHRSPSLEAEFGQSARIVQKWYRGYRTRKYIKFASHPTPARCSDGTKRSPVAMDRLFATVPPKAFIRSALSYQEDPERFRRELDKVQQRWEAFLADCATESERAGFVRFAEQLVVVPLNRVRTIEQELSNVAAATVASVPAAHRYRTFQEGQRHRRQDLGHRWRTRVGYTTLALTIPATLPACAEGARDVGVGLFRFLEGGLFLSFCPLLWPSALGAMAAGFPALTHGGESMSEVLGSALLPSMAVGVASGYLARSVASGVDSVTPSPLRRDHRIRQECLRAELAQLESMWLQSQR
jgi:hypothetical protein